MRSSFLFLILCLFSFALEKSKIVYLRLLSSPGEQRELYVGEKIEVKYSLLLFSDASLLDVEFIPNANKKLADGVELLNPNSEWVKQKDESYENTLIYKIKAPNFALPTLKIMAISQDGSYVDSDKVKGKKFEAIALDNEKYSSVLGKSMKISGVRSKKYDEWSNIIIFDLEIEDGNLEDFKLKGIEKQGFNGEIVRDESILKAVYYAVIPSYLKNLHFTFFNLKTLGYEEKVLPIEIKDDRVSTQADLVPKNNFLIFSNIVLLCLILSLIILGFLYRKKSRVFFLCMGIASALFLFLLYRFLIFQEVKLKIGTLITILPTQNSTIMQKVQAPFSAEVVGEHKGYYKIKFENSKIGWVKKNDCQ